MEAERLSVSQEMDDAAASVSVTCLLNSVGWVHHDIPLEMLARLAQHGFTCVPPPVQSMLQCAFRGWCQSVVNEKGFQCIKDGKRDNANKKVSRRQRYYKLITHDVINNFEREEVKYASALQPGVTRRWLLQSPAPLCSCSPVRAPVPVHCIRPVHVPMPREWVLAALADACTPVPPTPAPS